MDQSTSRQRYAKSLATQADKMFVEEGIDPALASGAAYAAVMVPKRLLTQLSAPAKRRAMIAALSDKLTPTLWPDETGHWQGPCGTIRANTVRVLVRDGVLAIQRPGTTYEYAKLTLAGELCARALAGQGQALGQGEG